MNKLKKSITGKLTNPVKGTKHRITNPMPKKRAKAI